MSAPTAAEIFKQVPQSLLDSQVSDVHISELAMEIERWEDFAPFFGLSRAQQEEIRRDNEGRYGLQKRVALWKWKEMKGKEATYRQLIIVFCCLHQNELGDSVKRLLLPMPKGQKSSGSILDTFRSYLVDCYAQTPHPSQNRWPFSRTAVYVDLPLFEAPLTEREPGSQEELPPLKLVELDTIFADSHNAERKVVLLEGVAGSGLTGLSSPAVKDILLEVTKHPLDDGEILSNKPQTESEDRRRLALALLNCIYETQDHTLCELIKPPANPTFNPQVYECNISFWCLGLSPRDCLSIGYFMAHHRSCNVSLIRCFLSESGIEALLNQLMKTPVTSRSCVRASLNLSQNRVTSKSMKLVSKALVEPSHLHVPWLFLDDSWLSSQAAINLMYLIEAFCKRSFSIEVLIRLCNITTKHIHLLVLLLTTCRCIRSLGLSGNDIGGAMALIAKALEQNTTLQAIILDHCNIGDESLTDLGKALQTHKSITSVWLAGNSFSQKALIAFLNSQFHSRLEHLEIGRPLNGKENHIYCELLLFRAMNSMPLLLVNRQSEQGEKTVHTADNNLLSLSRRVQSRVYKD